MHNWRVIWKIFRLVSMAKFSGNSFPEQINFASALKNTVNYDYKSVLPLEEVVQTNQHVSKSNFLRQCNKLCLNTITQCKIIHFYVLDSARPEMELNLQSSVRSSYHPFNLWASGISGLIWSTELLMRDTDLPPPNSETLPPFTATTGFVSPLNSSACEFHKVRVIWNHRNWIHLMNTYKKCMFKKLQEIYFKVISSLPRPSVDLRRTIPIELKHFTQVVVSESWIFGHAYMPWLCKILYICIW